MRLAAVIDKSLLHAICELPDAELDGCFNRLLSEFVLFVPSVLIDEVWCNWSRFKKSRERARTNMVRCLLHLQDGWVAEPLDIAFRELVEQAPVTEIPGPPPHVVESFGTLAHDDSCLRDWLSHRESTKDWIINDRLRQQRNELPTDKAILLANPSELLTNVVLPTFWGILDSPPEKAKLLDGVLGQGFRFRNPESGENIDAAFTRYTVSAVDRYPMTTRFILAALAYYFAPLCKVRSSGGEARKLLPRTRQGQGNNLADEKYVQTAFLVSNLLTRDRGMHSIMAAFPAAGLWSGTSVLVDPGISNISSALDAALTALVRPA